MIDRLLLVGCGLMGGSVAAALRAQSPSAQVWVVDPAFGEKAVEQGLANRSFPSIEAMLDQAQPSVVQGLLFATPAHVTAKLLPDLALTLDQPYALQHHASQGPHRHRPSVHPIRTGGTEPVCRVPQVQLQPLR